MDATREMKTVASSAVSDDPSTADFRRAQARLFERYGIEAESRFVDVPAIGGQAHVIVSGDGPPVVMAIGGGICAAMWAPLMAQLKGYTLYAIDLPGMGLSDPAPYTTERMRPMMVGFLEQVLDRLGLDRPLFVSQSMGSLFAVWMAMDRPERVAAISQIACPAFLLGTSAPLPMRMLSVPVLGRLMMRLQPPSPRQVKQFGKLANENFEDLPELAEVLLECERLPAYGPALRRVLGACIRIGGVRPGLELTEEMVGSVMQPVQFVWGTDDPFGPPSVGARAASIMPDAEFHEVPGGHGPWFSRPEVVGAHVLPFLEKHSAKAERAAVA